MDDLEFRRAVFAEPFSKDDRLQQAAAADPTRQSFLNDMRQFDDSLSAALKVDVPENLVERLILRQALESHQQVRRRGRVHLALAASVAFAIGLSSHMLYNTNSDNIGTYSLAHLQHGIKHLHSAQEANTLTQVNAKLARFGGKFNPSVGQSLGNAVFSNYCDFNGITSLHLIYDSPQGRVSVFVTPSDANFDFVKDFGNEQFVGRGLTFDKAQVTVVGNKGQSIEGFAQKVEESLSWEI
jgi:hypothetical protein